MSAVLQASEPRVLLGKRPSLRDLLPSRADYCELRTSWKGDIVAGVTVGIVALPLALAFAITAGVGAAVGLSTAIVAGLVAGIFGGSSLQISGPTGAMAVVLVPVVARYGPGCIYVVGLMAGILIAVAGVVRLGRAVAYLPWPLVEGFTVGIALVIFLQQVPAALGVAKPKGASTAVVAFQAVEHSTLASVWQPLLLVGLVVLFMVGLPRLHRALPASLLAVIASTLLVRGVGWDLPAIGKLRNALHLPLVPHLGQVPELASAAVAVAVLSSIESLLSAKVADGMADVTPANVDRELVGQGLGNIASALLGGMPATGAIARTAVNARAGARTRLSAVVHSVTLLVVVFGASSLVGKIPLAALAAVLMVTAFRMINRLNVRSVLHATRSDGLVLVVTAVATVATNLIVAIEVGIAVAGVMALRHVARSTTITTEHVTPEMTEDQEFELLDRHILVFRVDGTLFFGATQRFLQAFTEVSDVRVVLLRLAAVNGLDATGALALGDIIESLERRGITVLIKGLRPEYMRILGAVGALDRLAHMNHTFDDLELAIAHARVHAERPPHRAEELDRSRPGRSGYPASANTTSTLTTTFSVPGRSGTED